MISLNTINAINANIQNFGTRRINLLNSLNCDTVSFSGNKKPVKNNKMTEFELRESENVKKGTNAAKKLRILQDISTSTIEENFSKNSPVPIEILDVKDIPSMLPIPKNTIAHMLPMYSPELKLIKAQIFVNPNYSNTKEKNALIADSAHEFTHVLQRAKDKNYYGLKDNLGDISDVTNVVRASQQVLGQVVSALGCNVSNCYAFQHAAQNGKYQFTTGDVEKFCSERTPVKYTTNEIINSCVDFIHKTQLPHIDKDVLNKSVRQFIKQESLNEAEAYTVTLDVLKRCGDFDKTTYIKRNMNQGIYTAIYNSVNE